MLGGVEPVQVAPVPAYNGQPIHLRFDHPPKFCHLDVYTLAGDHVASILITRPDHAVWSTAHAPSGIYVMVMRLDDGAGVNGVLTKKVLVIR
jgi:hypothetical protein